MQFRREALHDALLRTPPFGRAATPYPRKHENLAPFKKILHSRGHSKIDDFAKNAESGSFAEKRSLLMNLIYSGTALT